jgi:tetratricopeptide (TPR) repeat protein
MKLSLAMIVKNETDNLGQCLESTKGLVDEIIVVDTGSTDNTIAVATANGAKVEQMIWADDFAEARNRSLSLCSGDWILVLDADEMLDPMEHPIIKQAILRPDAMGYRLQINNYLNGGSFFGLGGIAKLNDVAFEPAAKFSHYITRTHLRLFRNQNSPVYVGRVHEEIEQWFEKHAYETLPLDAVIHHFGKIDAKRELAKQPMYLELAKLEVADRPDDSFAHFNVLQSALLLRDWPTVLESAEKYLKLASAAPAFVYLAGARALLSTGKPEEVLDFIAPIEDQAEFAPALLVLKAEALHVLGDVQEAIEACLSSMDIDPHYTAAYTVLAKILDNEGDLENAYKVLEAGLDQNTLDQNLWEALVGLSAKHKDARVAQDAWYAIQAVPKGGQGIWHMIVAHVLNSQGDSKEALHVLDLGLSAFPGNAEIIEMKNKITGDSLITFS